VRWTGTALFLQRGDGSMDLGAGKSVYDKLETYQEAPGDRKRKILIVEDERLLCWAISKNLNLDQEYSIACLETGEEGLQFMERFHFDILILDYWLPGISGLKVLAKLEDKGIHIPVIMITASEGPDLEERALRAGVILFLRKPFKLGELKVQVKKILERSANAEGNRKKPSRSQEQDYDCTSW
jgi:DNA-binding NtrC family response regulator